MLLRAEEAQTALPLSAARATLRSSARGVTDTVFLPTRRTTPHLAPAATRTLNMIPAQPVLRLDYVEFATRDVAAAKKFYAAAFGWTFTDYGPDYAAFADGRLNGGFHASDAPPAKTNPLVVIFADDLESAAARVQQAGGKIVKPPFDFPGGRRFHFADRSGLELAVWSDRRADGAKIA